jgi:hypothetical protein
MGGTAVATYKLASRYPDAFKPAILLLELALASLTCPDSERKRFEYM